LDCSNSKCREKEQKEGRQAWEQSETVMGKGV
jgi:hypothetical protein